MTRNQAIDLIRGIDLILMVLFNYSVTLGYFGLIQKPSDLIYSFVFPRVIAGIFIFISGIAAYISYRSDGKNFRKKYFMRGIKLLIFAALITLFTHIFVPEGTVFFGILHFFAVSSFLVPFFIKYEILNMIAGSLIILSGVYLNGFDFHYPLLLVFVPVNFSTFDYFPLVPWLGALMLGAYSGKYVADKTEGIRFENKLAGIFEFLGKNSLTIYLIHQPVLVILLMLSGFKTFP